MTTSLDPATLVPVVIALVGAGCVSGLLAGLFGIGGGAVVVISLFEAFDLAGVEPALRMHLATGTALAVLLPTTLSSYRSHSARGTVDKALVRRMAPAVVAGVVGGILVARSSGGDVLKWVWVLMGSFLALRMALGRDEWRLGSEIPKSRLVEVYGAFVGFISSLMSIGGGAYITLMMTLYGRSLHQAVATSSGFGPLIALPAALGFMWAGYGVEGLPPGSIGYVSLIGAALVIPTGMLFAPIGARIAHRLPKRQLELGFAAFMGSVVLRYAVSLAS
jgi:uncharacterized membrane protein YfcA